MKSILNKNFYLRNAKEVAIGLLGKVLVRRINKNILSGIIVETEAYFGENDPASRASKGFKNFNKIMWEEGGKAFIYMVHGNWLFNIVTSPKGIPSAVLIRALQPLEGIDLMKKHRGINNIYRLTSGPGMLTKAFKIDKGLNGIDVTSKSNPVYVEDRGYGFSKICCSYRIGVRKDLHEMLRFFIKDNLFVSRPRKCLKILEV